MSVEPLDGSRQGALACRSRCAKCVRDRIVRAFLIEEQKQVKLVLQEKEKQEKKETKPAKK